MAERAAAKRNNQHEDEYDPGIPPDEAQTG
jgi:hypothetical protein